MSSEPQSPRGPAPQQAPTRPEAGASHSDGQARSSWGAFWAVAGGIVGFVVGAVGFGGYVQSIMEFPDNIKRAREVAELSGRVADLERDLGAREKLLSAEREAHGRAAGQLRHTMEAVGGELRAVSLKAEFLDRNLAHLSDRTDASRALLADAVCSLRKQSEAARIAISSTPIQLREEQIRGGLSAEVKAFLQHHGVSAELLAAAGRQAAAEIAIPQITPFNVLQVQRAAQQRRQVERAAREAVAGVQRHAQGAMMVRTVRFSDGTEYRVPEDVALIVHAGRDCRPG